MKKIVPENSILIPDDAKRVFSGMIFEVYQWAQKMYDGSTHTFEMLKRPDSVEVIAIKEGKVIIVKDEQPNRGAVLCFPGGRVDPGEDWASAALREVEEEIGHKYSSVRLVFVEQEIAKVEWFNAIFVANDVKKTVPLKHDAGEKIEVFEYRFEEFKDIVMHPKNTRFRGIRHLIGKCKSIKDLEELPSFDGMVVDR